MPVNSRNGSASALDIAKPECNNRTIKLERRIAETSPSPATSLSIWELNYLLAKMTVKEIMIRDVVTIAPDATAEAALALAQERRVGALVVVDEGHLVGIVTTNDFIYRILNPLLGLGKPGVRLHIYDCGTTRKIEEVVRFINRHDLTIEALHVDDSQESGTRDLIVQVDTNDPAKLIEDLTTRGYKVEIRERCC
ncbi:MAG: Inosine-5'-monophosphate dehydrogenase [Dehalococcoidia bacterium]|nr:Inosine-5'-monophosphate dehydrogenase [Chloroflexota bacterium]MBT9162308.1 Inosine-5'-monophosphate dehydrogenase [Chloroflexota bacterium]